MKFRSIAFLLTIFALIFALLVARNYISAHYSYLFLSTSDYQYYYLVQVAAWIATNSVFVVLLDVYFALFRSKLIAPAKKWAIGLLLNYSMLIAAILFIYYSYRHLLVSYLFKLAGSFEAAISATNVAYAVLIVTVTLLYIALAPIKYLLIYVEGGSLSAALALARPIKVLWRNKGAFVVWIFMGYFIAGGVGYIGEMMGSIMAMISEDLAGLALLLTIALNTAAIYAYYRYFVDNYVLDILVDLRG